MLVLTRKIQQQIQIGDNIRITVLQVKGNSVRLGIEAPRDVRVMRCELNAEPQLEAKPVKATTSLKARLAEMRNASTTGVGGFSSPEARNRLPKIVSEVSLSRDHVFVAAHAASDGDWSSEEMATQRG